MPVLAILGVAIAVVLIVYGRVKRRTPVAIAGYAVLALAAILFLLTMAAT